MPSGKTYGSEANGAISTSITVFCPCRRVQFQSPLPRPRGFKGSVDSSGQIFGRVTYGRQLGKNEFSLPRILPVEDGMGRNVTILYLPSLVTSSTLRFLHHGVDMR